MLAVCTLDFDEDVDYGMDDLLRMQPAADELIHPSAGALGRVECRFTAAVARWCRTSPYDCMCNVELACVVAPGCWPMCQPLFGAHTSGPPYHNTVVGLRRRLRMRASRVVTSHSNMCCRRTNACLTPPQPLLSIQAMLFGEWRARPTFAQPSPLHSRHNMMVPRYESR